MLKATYLITPILIINAIVAYFFQLYKQIICLPELFVLSFWGLAFWMIVYKPIKSVAFSQTVNFKYLNSRYLKIGVIGVGVVVLNLVFCFLLLRATMTGLYGCDISAINFLNTTLTNNISGSIFCYVAIVASVIHEKNSQKNNSLRQEFNALFQKITENNLESQSYIVVKSATNAKQKLALNHISHIIVEKNCVTIHSTKGRFVRYQSLKSLLAELSNNHFVRIHRSTVVNINHIQSIKNLRSGDAEIYLDKNIILRCSRKYKANLASLF